MTTQSWTPTHPALVAAIDSISRAAAEQLADQVPQSPTDVLVVPFESTHAVIFEGADPYAEEGPERWFAQLVVACGDGGATLHTASTTQISDNIQPEESVSFQAGQVLLFDAGNAHWVVPNTSQRQGSDARIILVGIKSSSPLDPAAAEELLADHLARCIPSIRAGREASQSTGRGFAP